MVPGAHPTGSILCFLCPQGPITVCSYPASVFAEKEPPAGGESVSSTSGCEYERTPGITCKVFGCLFNEQISIIAGKRVPSWNWIMKLTEAEGCGKAKRT